MLILGGGGGGKILATLLYESRGTANILPVSRRLLRKKITCDVGTFPRKKPAEDPSREKKKRLYPGERGKKGSFSYNDSGRLERGWGGNDLSLRKDRHLILDARGEEQRSSPGRGKAGPAGSKRRREKESGRSLSARVKKKA